MRLRITRIGSDPTVIFALDELSKYLRQEALAKTSVQWGRLVHHAKLSAQLAYALSLYADSSLEVRTQMKKLKEMAYEKYYETYDYMDVLFYTSILQAVTDSSASDFAREVETEIQGTSEKSYSITIFTANQSLTPNTFPRGQYIPLTNGRFFRKMSMEIYAALSPQLRIRKDEYYGLRKGIPAPPR